MTDITERQSGSASLATIAQVQKAIGVPNDGQIWVCNKDGSDLIILDTTAEIDANIDVDAGRNIVLLGRGVYDPFQTTKKSFIAGQQGSTFMTTVAEFTLSDDVTTVLACVAVGGTTDMMGVSLLHHDDVDVVDDLILFHAENGFIFLSNCEISSTAVIDTGSIKLTGGTAPIFAQNCEFGLGSSGCTLEGGARLIGGIAAVDSFGADVICSGIYVAAGTVEPATGMYFSSDDLVYSDGATTYSLKALLTA